MTNVLYLQPPMPEGASRVAMIGALILAVGLTLFTLHEGYPTHTEPQTGGGGMGVTHTGGAVVPNYEVVRTTFPLPEQIGHSIETFPIDANHQVQIYSYPLDEATGMMKMESRIGWEFTKEVKQEAWNREVAEGRIKPDANVHDYDFHHKIPVEVAKAWGLDPSVIRSAANCQPMPHSLHVDLHRQYDNVELARFEGELLELQLPLFNNRE